MGPMEVLVAGTCSLVVADAAVGLSVGRRGCFS